MAYIGVISLMKNGIIEIISLVKMA